MKTVYGHSYIMPYHRYGNPGMLIS